ncbi:hypothetical protein [Paenibacillus sp. TAF43_2]|uniref:hypothetical protein n=1 Tax=Paenibacillus sp. TAF43_2 TaxID=3233069 RepID=UPI003F967F04
MRGTRKLNEPTLPASPDPTSRKNTSQVKAIQKIEIIDKDERNDRFQTISIQLSTGNDSSISTKRRQLVKWRKKPLNEGRAMIENKKSVVCNNVSSYADALTRDKKYEVIAENEGKQQLKVIGDNN